MTKNNKKLVVSLFTLLITLCMFMSSTFAWFTDSASNTNNRIQAGTLDVDLLMYKESNTTDDKYDSIAGGTGDIFKEADYALNSNATLWEPGKTQWVYLAIKNEGSLALKYSVTLNIKDEDNKASMVQDNESALEYAIIPGLQQSQSNETLLKSKSWDEIKAYAQSGNDNSNAGEVTIGSFKASGSGIMDEITNGTKEETQYFVLAVHMKEEAGNKFKDASAIIDVTVNATQLASEDDGFETNTYDEAAQYYHDDCLTFYSDEGFTLGAYWGFCFGVTDAAYLETSTDHITWTKWDDDDDIIAAVQDGDKYYVCLRGTGLTSLNWTALELTPDNSNLIDCSGNVMTLLDYKNPDDVVMTDSAFGCLFSGCTSLRTAPTLPATTLAEYCYCQMFYECTSLISAPALPATTLAEGCYQQMFYECTSLISAPALPATTLAESCYNSMFSWCKSLTSAPALPATTLADDCYYCMFEVCESLTTAPALPATNLAVECYYGMFLSCPSLVTAPALPAKNLEANCYERMFHGCSSLASAPALPAETLADYCYSEMFNSCSSLISAPALPATTLAKCCYNCMFQHCTSLTSVPALPATTLAENCYLEMFYGCTSLYVSDSPIDSVAEYAWTIPGSGTFQNDVTYDQGLVFGEYSYGNDYRCLGTRSSDNMSGATGESHTYYTQNAPVSAN